MSNPTNNNTSPQLSFISLVWLSPNSLRYYLNLTYGSRQTVANQNRTDVHHAFDWFAFTLRMAGNAYDDHQLPNSN